LADAQNGTFVTAVYAILDLNSGRLRYANAGHNRPLLVRGSNGTINSLVKGGMALGVLENYQLQEHELTLKKGDYLLFYTDGVTETFSPAEEEFGEGRLMKVLSSMNSRAIAEVLARVEEELAFFREGNSPSDDVTMLGLRRL
jgi:phosphoserine phosphatase RsbU/P